MRLSIKLSHPRGHFTCPLRHSRHPPGDKGRVLTPLEEDWIRNVRLFEVSERGRSEFPTYVCLARHEMSGAMALPSLIFAGHSPSLRGLKFFIHYYPLNTKPSRIFGTALYYCWSGRGESNSVYKTPSLVYCRYTTPRLRPSVAGFGGQSPSRPRRRVILF